MNDQLSEVRAWESERREFSVAAREEALADRERAADEREAAADEREPAADERLRRSGQLDEGEGADRAQARADRARQRDQRETERAERAQAREQHAEYTQNHASGGDFPLAARFAELATSLFAAGTVGGVLDHLAKAAGEVIAGVDAASVTLKANGTPGTPAYSADLAYDLDQVQYRHGEGPCLDAATTRGPAYAHCPDLTAESPWPAFAPDASAAGGRAVLAFGMFPASDGSLPRMGSLNLYSTTPDAFEDGVRDVGVLLAAHGAVALASVNALNEATLHTTQLEEAMVSRDVIGQAKGILMERRRLTPEQAFDTLRDASNRLNVKLNELASRLTETGEAPPARRG